MTRIALDFLGSSFHDANENAASSRAFAANRRIPIGHSGHDLIVRKKIGDQLVNILLTSRDERAGCSRTGQLEKRSSSKIHLNPPFKMNNTHSLPLPLHLWQVRQSSDPPCCR
jgi:hypothetical protein